MLYQIRLREGKIWRTSQECDDRAAVTAIESWKSEFTNMKPTRYGARITRDYLLGMGCGEIGRFFERGQEMRITRIA